MMGYDIKLEDKNKASHQQFFLIKRNKIINIEIKELFLNSKITP